MNKCERHYSDPWTDLRPSVERLAALLADVTSAPLQPRMSDDKAQEPTEAMVEAGAAVLMPGRELVDARAVARAIYEAMEQARLQAAEDSR